MSDSDPNSIQGYKDLVAYGIGGEFVDGDPTIATNIPECVVIYGSVSLWAQHLGIGDKRVNLWMPAIFRWLTIFAKSGTGPAEVYE